MAGKSATIYVVDLGASTGKCHNGRTESDLDYGMRYVWDKIAENMLASRVSASIGVIGFRTHETDNPLAIDDDAYLRISILKPLGPMQISEFKDLQKLLVTNKTETVGDAISAIVVAIDSIDNFTTLKSGKPGKFERKIVLLTDGEGNIDDDDIGPIAEKMNEVDIKLMVA
jgi:ATP-dependent DNA helicase 2 subunit 2